MLYPLVFGFVVPSEAQVVFLYSAVLVVPVARLVLVESRGIAGNGQYYWQYAGKRRLSLK